MKQPSYYTGLVRWNDGRSYEVDVLAFDFDDAEKKVRERLVAGFKPGAVVVRVESWRDGVGR